MNATLTAPIKTRIAAFAAAILTSAVVLGTTVLGMASSSPDAGLHVASTDEVIVSAVN